MAKKRWPRALMLVAVVGAASCDPSSPPVTKNTDDIELPGHAGAGNTSPFEAGTISEAELETLRASACATSVVDPEHAPSFLELVIDTSGSMAISPESQIESKWELTRETLRSAAVGLPDSLHLGAVFFPNRATPSNCTNTDGPCILGPALDVEECIAQDTLVSLAPLGPAESPQREAFDHALTQVNPAGGTPTHDALILGLAELDGAAQDGERFLLLLTDGEPTYLKGCRGSGSLEEPVMVEPILSVIESAAQRSIRTFVVAAPGDSTVVEEEQAIWLSRAALLGGTARTPCTEEGPDFCHFDLTENDDFASALNDTVTSIMAQTKACTFAVPTNAEAEGVDPTAINVILQFTSGRAVVVGRSDGSCAEGWRLSDDEKFIQLCDDTCDTYRAHLHTTSELIFGCASAEVPVPR